MSNGSKTLAASLVALATLVLFVSPALGQEIRNYGDDGSDSGGSGGGGGQNSQTVYPGQPTPQQSGNQQQNNQRRQQQEGEGDEEMESYQIRVHRDSEMDAREGKKGGQSGTPKRPSDQMYKGIVPGEREDVDHLKEEREAGKSRSGPNRLTWIGFQPKDDKTRVFIQMAREPDYSVSREDDGKRIVVTLRNAKVTAGNFRRDIDTRYFERDLNRIRTKVVGETTIELHISLEKAKSPSVEAKEDYLYVDFAYDNPRKDDSDDESGE